MGLRLFVLFTVFASTNVAYAEGVVNVVEMSVPVFQEVEPAPAPAPVVTEVSAPAVQVFSQQDLAPTETQQIYSGNGANEAPRTENAAALSSGGAVATVQ